MNSNKILIKDFDYVSSVSFLNWQEFKGKSFFITGATGLIGTAVVGTLAYLNKKYNLNISITLLVRNISNAKKIFENHFNTEISMIEGTIENLPLISKKVDFIIHCASPTSSTFFAEKPVETIRTTVQGTWNVLEFAKNAQISGMVFLSSMEVYGTPDSDEKITENHSSNLDLSLPRNSYPESKRLCELLCVSFHAEYSVPVKILRLTQTFGPGVNYNDKRVFAEFARCVIDNNNIVLGTTGETKRNYLYTIDAVAAILVVLLDGKNGQAYNAANEDTYISIYDMAKFVITNFNPDLDVIIDKKASIGRGFAPILHMNLDTSKLRALGWFPHYSLYEMYDNMISWMKEKEVEK